MDGGTSGFHLLGLFHGRRHIILIDVATDGKPLGTVPLIHPRYASDFPPTLPAHDIGLKDLLESAALPGDLPEVGLIAVSIGELGGSLSMELTPAVATALPQIESLVERCLGNAVVGRVTPCAPPWRTRKHLFQSQRRARSDAPYLCRSLAGSILSSV